MKRLRWLTVLMGITLIIILGFQAYWLKDNYSREKRALEIKAGVVFQETMQQLQAKKLKLPDVFLRSIDEAEKQRIFVDEVRTHGKEKSPSQSRRKVWNTTIVRNTKVPPKADTNHSRSAFIIIKDSNGIIKKLPVRDHPDSNEKTRHIFIRNLENQVSDKRQIITTINMLRSKLNDSLRSDTILRPSLAIRLPKDRSQSLRKPSPARITYNVVKKNQQIRVLADSNNQALRVLYSVDSLQDSIHIPEIIKLYAATLKNQQLDIPFSVSKLDSAEFTEEQDLTDVTVGFANPVTYRLSLGGVAPYLIRKISLPILFSVFLIGVTLFSFVLLYRNLLRQQRLAEIKNEFISNISHELKTPIATVSIAIEALKNFNALHNPQKTKEYLDISSSELQRLGLLVDKVLKLSMFEKREVELNKESFDMKELTNEVLDTMKIQFDKNNALITLNTEGNAFKITADKLHITSVIYNLLDNALKYRNGNPVINVHLSDRQNAVELTVADNGIGIEEAYQSKIFDKFFRVPTGNKHIVKGYGLGLSYVSHIINQHKGIIKVDSEINKGSSFIITIPKANGEN